MDMNVFKGSDDYVVTKELMNAVNVCHRAAEAASDQGRAGHWQDHAG